MRRRAVLHVRIGRRVRRWDVRLSRLRRFARRMRVDCGVSRPRTARSIAHRSSRGAHTRGLHRSNTR
ncbi:hypothetical protein BURMUCF1_A0720 [Burkholderia multivorans ATCC BAA-247]|nr:hypothetical protein BURMUCF1_A0720 [Burkholderia multivorans ATCC BAA-247]